MRDPGPDHHDAGQPTDLVLITIHLSGASTISLGMTTATAIAVSWVLLTREPMVIKMKKKKKKKL